MKKTLLLLIGTSLSGFSEACARGPITPVRPNYFRIFTQEQKQFMMAMYVADLFCLYGNAGMLPESSSAKRSLSPSFDKKPLQDCVALVSTSGSPAAVVDLPSRLSDENLAPRENGSKRMMLKSSSQLSQLVDPEHPDSATSLQNSPKILRVSLSAIIIPRQNSESDWTIGGCGFSPGTPKDRKKIGNSSEVMDVLSPRPTGFSGGFLSASSEELTTYFPPSPRKFSRKKCNTPDSSPATMGNKPKYGRQNCNTPPTSPGVSQSPGTKGDE